MKKIIWLALIGVLCAAPVFALDQKEDRQAEKTMDEAPLTGEVASSLSMNAIEDAPEASEAARADWLGEAP